MGLPPLLAQIGLGAYFFGKRHRDLRPRAGDWNLSSLRELWGVGGWLTLHQAANLAVLYSANLIIANRLGPAAVPTYSVPYTMFMVLTSTASLIASPLLPAYAEAAAQGDWSWVRCRAMAALGATLAIVGLGGISLVAVGPALVSLWTGGTIRVSTAFLVALASANLLKAVSNANAVLLTGLGLVRILACIYLAVAVVFVSGAWILLPRFGLLGVPLVAAGAHTLDLGVSFPCALRYVRAKQK
jgi:O-antigen/teichoic acid export membrane protein